MSLFSSTKTAMVSPEAALPGRSVPISAVGTHAVLSTPMAPPYPPRLKIADLGLGCFWGAEKAFWGLPGVWTTAVGYQGGYTPNPTYEEVCTGRTGHAEVVRVVFDPAVTSYREILRTFWEAHDPTQGMRQGNDVGTQYRSAVYFHGEAQREIAEETHAAYQAALVEAGFGPVTTEIASAGPFYFAEDYHQQYLHKNPWGYCGIGGTGVTCKI